MEDGSSGSSRLGNALMDVSNMDYDLRRGSTARPTTTCSCNTAKLHNDDEKSRYYYEEDYVEKKKNGP